MKIQPPIPLEYEIKHLLFEGKVLSDGNRSISEGDFHCTKCGFRQPFSIVGISLEYASDVMKASTKSFIGLHKHCKGDPNRETQDA